MKVVALVSGGKDSCYVMMKCIQYGHEIVALANLLPVDDSVDELDSYMYQTVGHQIIVSYAECMNVPLFRRRIRGSSRHQKLSYQMTPDDEVEDLFVLLSEVKRQIPSITAVSSGAIASDYQRLRVESICSRLGLVSLAFLWKQDQTLLLQEMIANGIKAILVKVAAIGLDPSKHLGRDLAFMEPHLLKLKEIYGSNVCGEGGEYETLTLDCPLFTNARIVLDEFEVKLHSPDSIAPVGVLHPTVFHLEKKGDPDSNSLEKEPGLVFEVQGDGPSTPDSTRQRDSGTVEHTRNRVHLSKTGKENTFSICCWLEDSSQSSTGLREDLETVLTETESQLLKQGFNWQNVLYIHLYISDMSEFAVANETYVKFITHEKCPFGVPSRSTIELPLVQAGLGKAYVEVLVANDQSKRVLHVQSISSWAPSCIGPYSQATLHKGVLHMAGQLGLDPPTMNLRNEGAIAELDQALKNSEAIAEAFRCSISSSAILFVVFCSARTEQSERDQLHEKFVSFLDLAKSSRRVLDPMFLYILVPDLPKRALVEVKPVLYVEEDSETEDETRQDQFGEGDYGCWGYKPEEWYQDCVQKRVIDGKICVTVLSISAEVMKKLHEPEEEQELERVTRFCVYLLNKTLSENSFSWQDTTSLRIHFSTSLGVSVKRLSNIFETAFKELNEMSHGGRVAKEPIFNLVPVLGAGNSSASLHNVITCELFSLRYILAAYVLSKEGSAKFKSPGTSWNPGTMESLRQRKDRKTSSSLVYTDQQHSSLPLPIELVIDIFSRLSLKSIAICRCVSKPWAFLLGRSDFKDLRLKRSQARPRLLFAFKKGNKVFFLSSPQPQSPDEISVAADHLMSFSFDHPVIDISASVSGFFCVRVGVDGFVKGRKFTVEESVICNPSTGQSFTIPTLKTRKRVGIIRFLGYDPVEKLHKVLGMISHRYGRTMEHQVLTLGGTGTEKVTWRMTECGIPCKSSLQRQSICINGVLYYIETVTDGSGDHMIVCFDVRSEKYSFVKSPKRQLCHQLLDCNDPERHEWCKRVYRLPPMWEDVVDPQEWLEIVGVTGQNEFVMSRTYSADPFHVYYCNFNKETVTRVVIQGVGAFGSERRYSCHTYLNHVEDVKLM
ncbi:hypothetical protein YC2023_068733 [Brassica napus]